MMVMAANQRGLVYGYLAGKYPGRIGHLYSPGGMSSTHAWMPFALDNGRFPAWSSGVAWDEAAFLGMLDRVACGAHRPLWVLVPDLVGDRDGTLREWDRWCARIQRYKWPLAFAVQDGMQTEDVPAEAEVVFVGGTTEWKWRTAGTWCEGFERVHIGRVNTERWLWEAHRLGAESCDGTGWFRGRAEQLNGLHRYLERASSGRNEAQGVLFG